MKTEILDCILDDKFVGKRIKISLGKKSIVNYLRSDNSKDFLKSSIEKVIYSKKKTLCGFEPLGYLIDYKVISSLMCSKYLHIIVEIINCELDNG